MKDCYLDEKHSERKCVCKSMTKSCNESEHSLIMLWETCFRKIKALELTKSKNMDRSTTVLFNLFGEMVVLLLVERSVINKLLFK